MYRRDRRSREARAAQRKIQHVTAPTCSKSARSWLDRFNNATHVCKLWSLLKISMYRLSVDRVPDEHGLTVASHHVPFSISCILRPS